MSKFVKWSPIFNPDGLRPRVTDEYLGFVKRNENGLYMGGCYMYAYDTSVSIVTGKPLHKLAHNTFPVLVHIHNIILIVSNVKRFFI